ncbi:hypothetical protein EB796_007900 [Bugula neritina]|uniref:Uncharacterized protein n=1 Tax=Bugula neritina TaxID=10212 RepID=A0A7J7K771_BUGNE|nr:hypothetical protein EB796_007900 [Bugula neritina]
MQCFVDIVYYLHHQTSHLEGDYIRFSLLRFLLLITLSQEFTQCCHAARMKVLSSVLILSACLALSQALECYVCSSNADSGCLRPMDSKMKTMDCGESSSCATYTAGDADGGINVERYCEKSHGEFCKALSPFSKVCECETDYCNGEPAEIEIIVSAASTNKITVLFAALTSYLMHALA